MVAPKIIVHVLNKVFNFEYWTYREHKEAVGDGKERGRKEKEKETKEKAVKENTEFRMAF